MLERLQVVKNSDRFVPVNMIRVLPNTDTSIISVFHIQIKLNTINL